MTSALSQRVGTPSAAGGTALIPCQYAERQSTASSGRSPGGDDEWVKCMAFADSSTLYMGTHRGHLHLVGIQNHTRQRAPVDEEGPSCPPWDGKAALRAGHRQLIYRLSKGTPVSCLAVQALDFPAKRGLGDAAGGARADAVLLGSNGGSAAIVWVHHAPTHSRDSLPTTQDRLPGAREWQAYEGGVAVIGVFWCRGAEVGMAVHRGREQLAATVGANGVIRLWLIPKAVAPEGEGGQAAAEAGAAGPRMVAEAQSPSRARVTAVSACPQLGLMVCGNQDGWVISYAMPAGLQRWLLDQGAGDPEGGGGGRDTSVGSVETTLRDSAEGRGGLPFSMEESSVIRSAHGDSTVSSLTILPSAGGTLLQALVSSGLDGSMKMWLVLEGGRLTLGGATGLAGNVPSITSVFASDGGGTSPNLVHPKANLLGGAFSDHISFVAGFQALEFVAYSLKDNAEVGEKTALILSPSG